MSRVALIGAGFIARSHAEALHRTPGVTFACVIDPNRKAAERLAKDWGVTAVFTSVAEAVAADAFDRAHVLVPPDLHAQVAREVIAAGKPVLLEKPMATDVATCRDLVAQAATAGVALGVNQNFVKHPAMLRLQSLIDSGALGRTRFVSCLYNVPLRQLQSRQFGHWMFQTPGNLLLEQAVHPLSQIVALTGIPTSLQTIPGPMQEIAPGTWFCRDLVASFSGGTAPAQLRFAVGQSFPFWQVTVVGDDGVAVADILSNRLIHYGRTHWLDALDAMVSGLRTASGIAGDSVRNFMAYSLGMTKLNQSRSPFFASMHDSIASFHQAVSAGQPPTLDGAFGLALVTLCETMRDQAFPSPPTQAAAPRPDAPTRWDVAVLGGTGFIGRHVVRQLLDAGKTVAVMARSDRNLPAVFQEPGVAVIRGSIANEDDIARAIGEAKYVINLAHGGGSGSFAEVRAAMVGGAETVAKVAMARGVKRLVHVGSIAALYLGPQSTPITDATPPDQREAERADYARAKVLSDRALLQLHASSGLPVVILRPGVVVGQDGIVLHSGLGLFNNDQHCVGWNDGRNPLPFVLVGDVAAAIVRALDAPDIDGRCFNLVGDVRPNAREFIARLGRALHRPLRFHAQSPRRLWLEDIGKWTIKRAAGRQVPRPTMRDFLSRGMTARFDTTEAKRALAWTPEADIERFWRAAVDVHAD